MKYLILRGAQNGNEMELFLTMKIGGARFRVKRRMQHHGWPDIRLAAGQGGR